MKKRSLVLVSILAAMAMLAACGQNNGENNSANTNVVTETPDVSQDIFAGNAESLANIDTSEYLTLGDYKNMTISVDPLKAVTDEDILNYINEVYLPTVAVSQAVTDRAAVNGDTVEITFKGVMDGEEIESATTPEGKTTSLVLGSGTMIPGFEDGIVGMSVGEEKVLHLTFPDNYRPEMAGKDIDFTIGLVGITEKVSPELTDETVKNMNVGCNTVDELKALGRQQLEEEAAEKYADACKSALISTVMANCKYIKEPPKELYDYYAAAFYEQVDYYSQMFGITRGEFLETYYGTTEEAFEADVAEAATSSAREALTFEAIADAENLSIVTQEQFDKEAQAYIEQFGYYDSVDAMLEAVSKDDFRNLYIVYNRVNDFLNNNNTFVSN
ncbi:MAG: trigger factor [Lachnospiraceae bacterium]|nr:trigger factor [Candidatus Merdinaster equi]